MKTTLLTAVGSSSASVALQSLHSQGHRVIGCDIYPQPWNIVSTEVDAFFQSPLALDEAAYVHRLMDEVSSHRVDHLIPLTDVEVDVLCRRKADFASLGCTVCTPDEPCAMLCRDKQRMAETIADICRTIPTRSPYGWEPAQSDFPMMLKPLRGRSSQGQAVVENAQAFHSALASRSDYIAQPFIRGSIFTVDVARDLYGHTFCLAREELLRTVNGLGTTVRVMPGHALEAICQKIAGRINLVGVVNMEFIAADDAYYFLEVNPRFSGGVGFSFAAGADFIKMEIQCHQGEEIDRPVALKPVTVTRRIETVITE